MFKMIRRVTRTHTSDTIVILKYKLFLTLFFQVANKNRRMYSSTNSIIAAEEIREIRRLNLEAYNRPTFVPMAPGHSITARSLSKQIREELK